jgi:hypothetical protein
LYHGIRAGSQGIGGQLGVKAQVGPVGFVYQQEPACFLDYTCLGG